MASYTIHPRTGEILTPRRPAGDRAAIEISALSDTRKLKPSPRRLPPTSTTPSNRSEASALLAQLHRDLPSPRERHRRSEKRLDFEQRLELVSSLLSEAARQAAVHCAERGEVLRGVHAEYGRLFEVARAQLQKAGVRELQEALADERRHAADLQDAVHELEEREAEMKAQWARRKTFAGVGHGRGSLSIAPAAAGAAAAAHDAARTAAAATAAASAASANALRLVEALLPEAKAAVLSTALASMPPAQQAGVLAALVGATAASPQLAPQLVEALRSVAVETRLQLVTMLAERGSPPEQMHILRAALEPLALPVQREGLLLHAEALPVEHAGSVLAGLLCKLPPPLRARVLATVHPVLTPTDREALRGGAGTRKDATVQVALGGVAGLGSRTAAQQKASENWGAVLSGAWAPPRGWVSWVSASRQATRAFRPQAFGLEQLLEQSGRLFATKVKADAATATPGNSSHSFNEKRSAAQRSAVSLQRLLWQQLVGAHGSQQRARQQIVDLLFTAQTHAPSSARAEVVAELLGVTADAKTGEFSSCYLEHVVSFGASVIGKLYGPDVASTFADNQATPIPERAGAPNPSLHAVLHSTPPLLPSSVAAYVSTHCRTAALPVGAPNGGALYDADRLMLVCLKGYRAYIEHEQAHTPSPRHAFRPASYPVSPSLSRRPFSTPSARPTSTRTACCRWTASSRSSSSSTRAARTPSVRRCTTRPSQPPTSCPITTASTPRASSRRASRTA